jgi:DNA-binding NarL/FixJ family response regulator
VDVDAEGNVLGFEFLSFEEYVEAIDQAGALEVPERLAPTLAEEDISPAEIMAALTPREREVLQLLTEGLTTQEVASRLSISQAAVKQHFRHVVGVFRAHSAKESSSRPGTLSS